MHVLYEFHDLAANQDGRNTSNSSRPSQIVRALQRVDTSMTAIHIFVKVGLCKYTCSEVVRISVTTDPAANLSPPCVPDGELYAPPSR